MRWCCLVGAAGGITTIIYTLAYTALPSGVRTMDGSVVRQEGEVGAWRRHRTATSSRVEGAGSPS
jgi:hypothetical protein